MPSYTVSAEFLGSVLWSASQAGLATSRWEAVLASTYARADRVPLAVADDVWSDLIAQDPDRLLGLKLARHFRLGRWGMVESFILNARTLGDALAMAVRYWRLVADEGKRIELVDDGVSAELRVLPSVPHPPVVLEMELAYVVQMLRLMLGEPPAGLAIGLRDAVPAPMRVAFEDAYGCPVDFAQPHYAIRMPSATLRQALPGAHPVVWGMLKEEGDRQLRMLGRGAAVGATVEQLIGRGALTIDAVAAQLAMSARSLQRRLRDEGLSFAELRDRALAERASRLLREPRMPLKEVAFFLGYEERGFFEACQRWFGSSPSDARARMLAAHDPPPCAVN